MKTNDTAAAAPRTTGNTAADFEPLFVRLERAIAENGKFSIAEGAYPKFTISRYGWDVEIRVKLVGSRKRPTDIKGEGETPDAAVGKLVSHLDLWADACA